MRHLTVLGDPGLPERAFLPDPMGRIQPQGGGGGKDPPDPPPPPPAPPEPQASKNSDSTEMIAAKKTKAKAKPDLPDTMLTGPSGVDMNSLEVAKPTLLGG